MNSQTDNPFESPSGASQPSIAPTHYYLWHCVFAIVLPFALMPLNQMHAFDPHGFPEFLAGGLVNGLVFRNLRASSKRRLFLPLFLCYFGSSIIAMLAWGAISLPWMLGGLGFVMSAFFAGQCLVGELIAWGLQRLRRNS